MEVQQQQTVLLREGILAAQQTTTAAMERATTPREPRIGNVADFRKLGPKMFSENKKPLQAEQWLTDTENLLKATRVPEADQVEVVKIQLTDIARTWWLVEKARLTPPITWKQFTEGFNERFFPTIARQDMEEEFLNLGQKYRTIDEYAAEFLRLSRFATYMVATEENIVSQFQHGLRFNI